MKISLLSNRQISPLTLYHDFPKLVALGADVVHQHFVGSQLVLDGQWVVLALLDFLQLDPVAQVAHHLHPETGLGWTLSSALKSTFNAVKELITENMCNSSSSSPSYPV